LPPPAQTTARLRLLACKFPRPEPSAANKQLERSARLNRIAVESDEHLDESTQSQRAAAAAVEAAEAAIHAAQLNIEFTHIVAPFSGRVSRRHVSIGSLITGGPGATTATELTTIVSLDPIYLDFDLSEADYAAYQHSAAARPSGANAVQISVDGERPWARAGDLDFLDNEIDRRSGTLHARATLANPDMMIAPGGFAVCACRSRPACPSVDDAHYDDQADRTRRSIGTCAWQKLSSANSKN
jgi:RND family efflux transporter MFP subunit